MKKLILILTLLAGTFAMNAQGIHFGLKAGANFSNFNGDIDTEGITNFHAGGVLELNIIPMFSIQAEGLFSSQGGEGKSYDSFGNIVDESATIKLDYIAVPVLAKFYILPDRLSLMAGPQFSFLVNDAKEEFNAKTFDFAVAGGAELKLIAGLFVQARYTIGVNNAFDDNGTDIKVDAKNAVFQLSVGYMF